MRRFIELLQRWHILSVDEPWVPPPEAKYKYYHCWFPPYLQHDLFERTRSIKGRYSFQKPTKGEAA